MPRGWGKHGGHRRAAPRIPAPSPAGGRGVTGERCPPAAGVSPRLMCATTAFAAY